MVSLFSRFVQFWPCFPGSSGFPVWLSCGLIVFLSLDLRAGAAGFCVLENFVVGYGRFVRALLEFLVACTLASRA